MLAMPTDGRLTSAIPRTERPPKPPLSRRRRYSRGGRASGFYPYPEREREQKITHPYAKLRENLAGFAPGRRARRDYYLGVCRAAESRGGRKRMSTAGARVLIRLSVCLFTYIYTPSFLTRAQRLCHSYSGFLCTCFGQYLPETTCLRPDVKSMRVFTELHRRRIFYLYTRNVIFVIVYVWLKLFWKNVESKKRYEFCGDGVQRKFPRRHTSRMCRRMFFVYFFCF